MPISVVQSTSTATFAANVTAGNTVFLVATATFNMNVTITSSNPTLGPSSPAGSALWLSQQSPFASSFVCYFGIWMMPNCPGNFNNLGISIGPGGVGGGVAAAYEVAGLGATPFLDLTAASNGNSTAVDSGPTGAIRVAGEFVLGHANSDNPMGAAPAGWTSLSPATSNFSGYQLPVAAGISFDWAQTQTPAGPWVAGIVTASPVAPPVASLQQQAGGRSMLRKKLMYADV